MEERFQATLLCILIFTNFSTSVAVEKTDGTIRKEATAPIVAVYKPPILGPVAVYKPPILGPVAVYPSPVAVPPSPSPSPSGKHSPMAPAPGPSLSFPFPTQNTPAYNQPTVRMKLGEMIGSILGGSVVLLVIIIFILSFARKRASATFTLITRGAKGEKQNVEALFEKCGGHALTRYTYRDIRKMTSNFKHKLGEGGYGGVYKGMLDNGFPIAIKLLKKSEGDGREFINEVASILGTNHVNIVTLIGFCFQGPKRALVYEFVPNGSLDKYMYGQEKALEWGIQLQIAIGIARGLEYLHRGCNTRILHFDIKPQNILLDEKFCPKIADFGLARPCLQKESIVTISGARGTPGYIAPEVFCRGFGGASHKSDVYSYGMLVLDMVGCRKKNVGRIEQTMTSSDLYFPYWIYKQFDLIENSELQGISNDEEKKVQRKMVIVSLWCIQTSPSSRPPISRVIEMLEGPLDSLQVPPVPHLFSPPRSPDQQSSTTHSMTL